MSKEDPIGNPGAMGHPGDRMILRIYPATYLLCITIAKKIANESPNLFAVSVLKGISKKNVCSFHGFCWFPAGFLRAS